MEPLDFVAWGLTALCAISSVLIMLPCMNPENRKKNLWAKQKSKKTRSRTKARSINIAKYEGQFDTSLNGKGTAIYPSGRKLEGEFSNGKLNGRGIVTYPDGDKTEGMFKNYIHKKQGTMTLQNGTKIEGEFKNGKLIVNFKLACLLLKTILCNTFQGKVL